VPNELIHALIIGNAPAGYSDAVRLRLPPTHASGFNTSVVPDDAALEQLLIDVRPQVIVTLGPHAGFARLHAAPLEVRKRWLAYGTPPPPEELARAILECFVANATQDRLSDQQPLISVFTSTYLTGPRIQRPLRSLLAQSYSNWEWVIYDDSPDQGAFFAELTRIAGEDHRISVYRAHRHSGRIGEVKRRNAGLCRGQILVELDHDDELHTHALAYLASAAARFPEAGFFYTDCAEIFENNVPAVYGENFAFGFGAYRRELYAGTSHMVAITPPLNAKTLRHIVGVPNHLRAWRRAVYAAIGGHAPDVHVCDDYELLVRTFLATRMCHIRALGYIQYHNRRHDEPANTGNTQRTRNAEIQRLSDAFMLRYNQPIHDRLLELGAPDFIWRGGHLDFRAAPPSGLRGVELTFDP
jgi:glycosyltransferase involved in cell wall biosynthesis